MAGILGIGAIILSFTVGGMFVGYVLQGLLPKSQLTPETRDVAKLVIGLVGTLSALVLGLMISSAKGSYDRQRQEIIEMSTRIVLFDRNLALYGPEAQPIRDEFRRVVAAAKDRLWPKEWKSAGRIEPSRAADTLYHDLQRLAPTTPDQRFYHARALALATEVLNGRWLLYHQTTSSISIPLVAVIVVWFGLIFACIGMLAPRNTTVLVMLFICAVSVSGAVVLAFELDRPFSGIIRMSSEPFDRALDQLGRP